MKKQIKALLLAAGLGTRLQPITNSTPKCLVEVGGGPILYRWLKNVDNLNCSEIIINTHHLSSKVQNYLSTVDDINAKICICHEQKLRGTAGTLIDNSESFSNTTGIMVHVDNMTDVDLKKLVAAHERRPKKCILTMLTFETDNPSSCGIVEIDKDNVVTAFHEKVSSPPGNRANGAVYVFEPSLFKEIGDMGPGITDFSREVLPNLIGRIYTWHTQQPYIDIGTPLNLNKARKLWDQ